MTDQVERKIHRSPNHPFFDLKEAVEKIKVVYEKEKRSATSADVIVKHLGYGALNGPGGRTLSGLRQYGLLEEGGGRYKISDDAFTLLHYSADTDQRKKALKKTALSPTLYRELYDRFPDLSASDETLRVELLGKGFNPEVIHRVVSHFRSTMQFAGFQEGSYIESPPEMKMETYSVAAGQPSAHPPLVSENLLGSAKSYAFAFAGAGRAELKVVGEYTIEDLEDLKTYLEITMRGLIRSKSD